MRELRWGLVVAAVVIGGFAVAIRNWWTAVGMLCLLVAQVLSEREARRRAARGEGAAPPPE